MREIVLRIRDNRAKLILRYDESKHPRDEDGKFGSGGGGGGSDKGGSSDKGSSDKGGGSGSGSGSGSGGSHAPHAVHEKAKTWGQKLKSLPAKVVSAVRSKVKEKFDQLESRYGRKWAIAIMAAGIMAAPIPVPGSSLLAAAPLMGMAELHRLVSRADNSKVELSDEEVEKLGRKLLKELHEELASILEAE